MRVSYEEVREATARLVLDDDHPALAQAKELWANLGWEEERGLSLIDTWHAEGLVESPSRSANLSAQGDDPIKATVPGTVELAKFTKNRPIEESDISLPGSCSKPKLHGPSQPRVTSPTIRSHLRMPSP